MSARVPHWQRVASLMMVACCLPAAEAGGEPRQDREASSGVEPAAQAPRPDVELNTATRARLESVRGIGPQLAAALLAAREARPFTDWADLVARVRGIGPASARRLSAHGLRVDGRPWPDGQ